MKPIVEVAQSFGINEEYLELYGKYKSKLDLTLSNELQDHPDGKLVLVTAMNPTPAGEGKTLTTIGLVQALNAIGEPTIGALREPSLGPCFGMKGGATGSNKAQIVPSEDINLHFTGDIHAITSAHNLLSAMIDNHIFHGNELRINPQRILWKRAMDMNDRCLRNIVTGLGAGNGAVQETGFMITTASEIMAVLCLSKDLADLEKRLGQMLVAYNEKDEVVTAAQLGAVGAMVVLLKDAIKPNLVQTIEGTPVVVHGGPFANIAHGCSSVIATKLSLKLAKIVVTEAGFGADLGAEKFFNIKCRQAGLTPAASVLVVTVKALKYNGGASKLELDQPNPKALELGLPNMKRHIENIQKFGVPVMVAINHFASDQAEEIDQVIDYCKSIGVKVEISKVWAEGSQGGIDLARTLTQILDAEKTAFTSLYSDEMDTQSKIEKIVQEIYRGAGVSFSPAAVRGIKEIERLGFNSLPVCMAKTPYSFSDQPQLLGAPEGFTLHVRAVSVSAGAGFIVVHTGNIVTMPGLPKSPAAEHIYLDKQGEVIGLM
ncbi:formate--tetrahydrofolate ligase [Paenibacillus anaericanus]|uniref:Formate--tetrahydrofolate ligase n=1 Tax=Paenibacillus anaericanus TaxID=170367 RepID=A0A3S1E5K8_9BACL|nr:formate--tetrahydrofolate ligase [Paenibacillus anaericanus]RUT38417.1 formate--tetrahydrofolate ligase [Paenibacillus anaericanus]